MPPAVTRRSRTTLPCAGTSQPGPPESSLALATCIVDARAGLHAVVTRSADTVGGHVGERRCERTRCCRQGSGLVSYRRHVAGSAAHSADSRSSQCGRSATVASRNGMRSSELARSSECGTSAKCSERRRADCALIPKSEPPAFRTTSEFRDPHSEPIPNSERRIPNSEVIAPRRWLRCGGDPL